MVEESYGYLPERGDIVWLQFDSRLGHEQSGRCPALGFIGTIC
jgi:mRNA interferase MazF